MKGWEKVVVSKDMTIQETIQAIDTNALQISLVVDNDRRLLGTITDGDIRRGILKGLPLESPVTQVMNPKPITASASEPRDSLLFLMKKMKIHHVPVVDEKGILIGLEMLDDLLQHPSRSNPVILMAGGLGSRLRPLTNDCPKPLLKVKHKPILDTIIDGFVEHGFSRFYISVNYKAEMIEEYFGDGSQKGIEISYLREKERMGTAGALGLLPDEIEDPLIVMNGDLLTKVNYSNLLNFHSEHHAKATMCVREYNYQVPYGVVQVDNHRLSGVVEKPLQRLFVSAGIYVLEPDVLDMIPPNVYYDMPSLFERVIEGGLETTVFPVREYWRDIGQLDDFEQANADYTKVFAGN